MEKMNLFKAKRKDNNRWIEGFYVKAEGKDFIIKYGMICGNNDFLSMDDEYAEIDPATLSQYIEWRDDHGQRIFENDIVEFVSSPTRSEKYLIWWNREMSMTTAIPLDKIERNGGDYYNHVKYHTFTYDTFCLMMQDPWGDFRDIKVIGNLFDNPELLEGEDRWKD